MAEPGLALAKPLVSSLQPGGDRFPETKETKLQGLATLITGAAHGERSFSPPPSHLFQNGRTERKTRWGRVFYLLPMAIGNC